MRLRGTESYGESPLHDVLVAKGLTITADEDLAQLNLLAAKAKVARAQRDYSVARVTLEWVTGTLDTGRPNP